MALAKFIADDDFMIRLERAATDFPSVAEKVIRAGAAVLAPVMRRRLSGILSASATGQLVAALGITPVKQDRNADYNAHIGFDGYQQPGYGKFPIGVPFALIARSFESVAGDWRPKTPFARPAMLEAREAMSAAMTAAAEEEYKKIMGG